MELTEDEDLNVGIPIRINQLMLSFSQKKKNDFKEPSSFIGVFAPRYLNYELDI